MMDDDIDVITIQRGSETIRCYDYAADVMGILLDRSKKTNNLWERLLPLLWEIEAQDHHLDTDLLFDKLMIEAKLFNRMRSGEPT